MSKKRNRQEYEKSLPYRFKRWMSAQDDPFVGHVEMQPQQEPKHDVIEENAAYDFEIEEEPVNLSDMIHWRRYSLIYRLMSIVVCVLLASVLVYAVSYLPPVGNPSNPTNGAVPQRYIEKGYEETGAENIVTGMILTYRVFDTFGETTVLFAAASAVMLLLLGFKGLVVNEQKSKDDIILQRISRLICPIVFAFGLYIILNGSESPGGGFSGGAVLGAGLVLYNASFGSANVRQFFGMNTYIVLRVITLFVYGVIGLYYFYVGANGLDNALKPGAVFGDGIIFPIDIAVGIGVACTIYAFYCMFRKGEM